MVSLSCILNNITLIQDIPKHIRPESATGYYLSYFFYDILLIVSAIVGMYISPFLSCYHPNLPFIFQTICIIALIMAITNITIWIEFRNDYNKCYPYRWRSRQKALEYSHDRQIAAYAAHKEYNIPACIICSQDFRDDAYGTAKTLLPCGHAYHTECLYDYEWDRWTSYNTPFPYCRCPLCGYRYDIWTEKYLYKKYYTLEEAFFGGDAWKRLVPTSVDRYIQGHCNEYDFIL